MTSQATAATVKNHERANQMKDSKKAILAVFVILALLTVIWWFTGKSTSGVSASPELKVEFVCFTNNPVATMAPVRICVSQGTTGFCALFCVTNPDSTHYAKFDTTGLEVNNGHGWAPAPIPGPMYGVNGGRWGPGYGCLYAVAWPPGLSTNAAWRLQVSVAHELVSWNKSKWGIRERIDSLLGRELFGLADQQTITSSEVRQ